MTPSCPLGFQATRPATWVHFIHPLFIERWRITAGCKHNSARLDKWLEILGVEGFTPKER